MNQEVSYNIVYYIGLILLLGGLISQIVFLCKIKKNEERYNSFKELIKVNKFKFILPLLSFIIGFISLNVAFFIDPNTGIYLKEAGIEIKGYHEVMAYLGGALFSISLFSLLYSLFTCLYMQKFNVNKSFRRWWFTISLLCLIASFYLHTEGNAPYLKYPLANALYIGLKGIHIVNAYNQGKTYSDGLMIYLYAIVILSGACLVLFVADYKIWKKYGKHDLITNTFLVGFPSGIIGARIWYVILSISKGESNFTGSNWVNIFDFRDGGLGIMGGAILGIIAGVSQICYMKYKKKNPDYIKMDYLLVIDIIVPCILFAQAIGRVGNFFNNEVYGGMVDIGPWEFLPSVIKNNMYYNHGYAISDINTYIQNGKFQLPLFFIEGCTNLAGYFILTYLFGNSLIFKPINKLINKKRSEEEISKNPNLIEHSNGSLLGGYILWYGLTRCFLEGLRNSSDYFRSSEITSYVMIALGILLIVCAILNNYILKRKKLWWYAPKKETLKEE